MNAKTISKVLLKKHEEFLSSITDDTVRALVNKNSIITGGAIVSMLLNEEINDYDYYFTDKETCKAVAQYYTTQFCKSNLTSASPVVEDDGVRIKITVKSVGVAAEDGINPLEEESENSDAGDVPNPEGGYWRSPAGENHGLNSQPGDAWVPAKAKYRPLFITSNAITLANKIQLIIRFFGPPEEIHKNYDFAHCTNYWLSKDHTLHLNQVALEYILTRTLHYVGSRYPVSSIIRTRKFIKKGWRINAGQYLKICFQVSELNLKNLKVLEDQLTGVDCAYFFSVIEYCRKRMEEDKEFQITLPYLIGIIDNIF